MTFRDLIDSPIAYHRCFVGIAGSVAGAVFLSQVCYWSKRTKRRDGFFYKTDTEWCEETGIPARTQDRIRAVLRSKGILLEKVDGTPATVHFKLNEQALISYLSGVPSGMASTCQVAELNVPSGMASTFEENTGNTLEPVQLTTDGTNRAQDVSETTTETTLEETATAENIATQPCSKCGAIGRHRCGGYKSQKQQERDRRRASQPKFTPERELRPAYRERPTPAPESSDLDEDYPRL